MVQRSLVRPTRPLTVMEAGEPGTPEEAITPVKIPVVVPAPKMDPREVELPPMEILVTVVALMTRVNRNVPGTFTLISQDELLAVLTSTSET